MTSLEDLFERFRSAGDPDALSEVYDRTAPRLLRNALHLAPSAAHAEDLLQATFLTTIEKRDSYDAMRPLLPWLLGILSNQARLARWRDGRAPDPGRLTTRETANPLEQVQSTEFTEAVDDAVAGLPEVYQSVLVLHLRHGLPPIEIAHALRRPPGTVRAQLARGLEKLRATLPASLAGGLALLATQTRGLAAVREAVLAQASTLSPPAATAAGTTLVLGALAMKKLLLGAAAVSAASLLWWSSTSRTEDAPPAVVQAPTPIAPMSVPIEKLEQTAPPPAPVREALPLDDTQMRALAAAVPSGPGKSTVDGRAVWKQTGGPAAGVTIWCQNTSGHTIARVTTRTDASGSFDFSSLSPGTYLLGTDRGGQASVVVKGTETGHHTLVLEIPRGCRVTGIVRDEDRQPVAQAVIWLSDRYVLERGSEVAVTGADGRYTVESVGAERYVGARARGYRPSTVHYIQAQPSESVELDVTLVRGAAQLRGRAFDAAGQPVAGAVARIGPPGRSPYVPSADNTVVREWAPVITHTDESGSFAADGLPPGILSLQVRAAGHGVFRQQLEVPAGATGDVVATLPAAATVHGRATTAEGHPVALAMVRTGAEWDDFALSRTATDKDGNYELRDVTPGLAPLAVIVGGRVAHQEELQIGPGQTVRWDPVLQTPGAVAGRVVDGAHRPLSGWNVTAKHDETSARTVTDDQGRFRLEDLPVEAYELRVAYQPAMNNQLYLSDVAAIVRENVRPGGAEMLLEVPTALLPSCSVQGRVVDSNGSVVPQTRISIGNMDARGVVAMKVDAGSGSFAVEKLVPGPYWITARAPGYPWIRVGRRDLQPGQNLDLGELTLRRGIVVEGRLRPAPGATLEGVEVEVLNERNEATGVIQLRGTAFRTSELEPGSYRVLVRGDGLAVQDVPFRVIEGQDTTVEVPVAQGARRQIRAVLEPGHGQPERVWLTLMQGVSMLGGKGLELQPDGSYTTDLWVGPGQYTVWVGTEGAVGSCELQVDASLATAPVAEVVMKERD